MLVAKKLGKPQFHSSKLSEDPINSGYPEFPVQSNSQGSKKGSL
jgi:hypothetical protein